MATDTNTMKLPDDAVAVFSFLLAVANGRDTFQMTITEMLRLTSRVGRDRFVGLCRDLESMGLIGMTHSQRSVERAWRDSESEHADEPDTWTIKHDPHWKIAKLTPGKSFFIPGSGCGGSPRSPKRYESPERAAYSTARGTAARRGVAFAYGDYESFLRDVGKRPPGTFRSGRSTYALFPTGDGRYEWRSRAGVLE